MEVRRDGTDDWNVFNSFREPSWTDHTFFGFYYDEEYTQPVTFPYTYTEENPDVYARFLEGEWLLVSSPAEFAKIRYNTNVWLMNDIDMSKRNSRRCRACTRANSTATDTPYRALP